MSKLERKVGDTDWQFDNSPKNQRRNKKIAHKRMRKYNKKELDY